MTEKEAKEWKEEMYRQIDKRSPEEVVAGLAEFVLMKDKFESRLLYHLVFKTIVGKLYLKMMEIAK